MQKGDRVEFKNYEHKGKQGNVISVSSNIVVVVKVDGIEIPIATTKNNLKLI